MFVREGARVVLSARREELVREAADGAGEGAIAMRADVTNEDDVAAMVARAVDEFGQVANLALFLASDASRIITGQSIPVDAEGYMQG